MLICGLQHSHESLLAIQSKVKRVIISHDVEFNETHIGLNMDKILVHLGNSLLELSDVDIEEFSQGVFPFEQKTMMECGNFNWPQEIRTFPNVSLTLLKNGSSQRFDHGFFIAFSNARIKSSSNYENSP